MINNQMSGTLADDINIYNQQQEDYKEPAQPVKNYKYSYPNHYHNRDQQQTTFYQNQSLKEADDESRRERRQLLKERFGIGEQVVVRKSRNPESSKWGNFLVLYDGNFAITLGPDYWCFIPTFICFCLCSIGVLYLEFAHTQNILIKLSGIIICFGQIISYLLIATSNPGIAREDKRDLLLQSYTNPQNQQAMKLCKKCGYSVPKSSFHCRECDLCILEYDHHCPWTSKCIGRDNMCRFYFFLIMTPIYLIYVAVAFVIIMSEIQQQSRTHRIKKILQQIFFN